MWKTTCILVILALTACTPLGAAAAEPAFEYPPIIEPILSASVSVDFAAMNAHRMLGGLEMNFVRLIDPSGGLPNYDASDDLFDDAGHQLSGADVIEEEEGLSPLDDDVVHTHRHQIDAHGVVTVHEEGDLELGADAIGR